MPSRAYTSFLLGIHSYQEGMKHISVSMPSRAYTSFLLDVFSLWSECENLCVNALSGLYIISTISFSTFFPGTGTGCPKDSTLNAKRSGSLWHKRTRITLLGRKQWMLLSFLLDKWKKRKLSTCFFRIMGISRSESGEFSFRFWGFSIDKTQLN